MVDYNLCFLPEVLQKEIQSQIFPRLCSGSPKAESYGQGRVLPCFKRNIQVYQYDGGVVDAQGHFVEASGLHEAPCLVGGSYSASCQKSCAKAIYIGFLLSEWGNTITDSLKKLWFLNTPEGKRLLLEGAEVVYVTFENQPLKEYQLELFRLAGFDATKWKQITQPTQFSEVIVPGNSLVTSPNDVRFYYSDFLEIVRKIKLEAAACAAKEGWKFDSEKIYLTRTRWKQGRDSNEKQIEDVFRRLGYQIISPEQLGVARQIMLMSSCSCMAATEGSISHNALFMSSGSELIVLRKADYINDYQLMINEISGLRVTYIPVHHSTKVNEEMPWVGPFYLCLTPQLKAWSGLPLPILPVGLQPQYWKYCLLHSRWLTSLKLKVYLLYRRFRKN